MLFSSRVRIGFSVVVTHTHSYYFWLSLSLSRRNRCVITQRFHQLFAKTLCNVVSCCSNSWPHYTTISPTICTSRSLDVDNTATMKKKSTKRNENDAKTQPGFRWDERLSNTRHKTNDQVYSIIQWQQTKGKGLCSYRQAVANIGKDPPPKKVKGLLPQWFKCFRP